MRAKKNIPSVCPNTGKQLKCRVKNNWVKWLFPITGLIALIWFLVRVIPKPSRATYPCQRVAFPLASSFIAYILGLLGTTIAVRKAKRHLAQSRYVLASICVLIGLACAWLTVSINAPWAKADTFVPTDPANSPMGVAKGIYPGQVVWVHDPNATDWDGFSNYYWDDVHIDANVVEQMMSDGVRWLTSEVTVAAAWQALFRDFNRNRGKGDVGYRPGEKITIKPNFNEQRSLADEDNYIDLSPQIVVALLKQLVWEVGIDETDIIICDSARYVANKTFDRCYPLFPDVNYLVTNYYDSIHQDADDRYTDPNRPPVEPTTENMIFWSGASGGAKLPQPFVDASYVINVAIMKCHSLGGVTLTGKNWYGCFCEMPAGIRHDNLPYSNPGENKYRLLVDVMGHEHLGGKTILFIMDGLWGSPRVSGAGSEPVKWQMTPFNNDYPSSIFMSQDHVAIDSVALDFLRTEFEGNMGRNQIGSGIDDYLHEAALANNAPSGTTYDPEGDGTPLQSLGAHEHWNDSTDKKYSRNLGTGSGIELVSRQDVGVVAYVPRPIAQAEEVPPDVNLSWAPAFTGNAAQHDIYLGTDYDAVLNADVNDVTGIYRDRHNLDANTYNPTGDLDLQTMYFWRIDEVNEPNIWKGYIWSFFTAEHTKVIDDMESYNGNKIYNTWIDRLVNGTGSLVSLETDLENVHRGLKSMKYAYDNASPSYGYYSETERTLASAENWTANNAKALVLYFKGDPCNATEQMYIALADSTNPGNVVVAPYDGDANDIKSTDWQIWNINMQDFNDGGVDLTKVKKIYIGFGDRDNPQQGGTGSVYIDDIRLYLSRCIPNKVPASFNDDCMVDFEDLDMMAGKWLVSDYNLVLVTVEPNANNLVGWWKFDEGTGSTAEDSSASNNDGYFTGTPNDPTWVAGMTGDPCGYALGFDGQDDMVILSNPLPIFSSSFTVSMWVKAPSNASGRVGIILGDYATTNAISVNFELHDDGQIRFYWNGNPNEYGSIDLRDDSWHLVTFVRDKDAEKVYGYIDDAVDIDYSGTIDDKTATVPHRIGRDLRTGDTAFEGLIDDVRIYNYALSYTEILYLITQGGTSPYVPFPEDAVEFDLYQDKIINFKDYAILADGWLKEQLWP